MGWIILEIKYNWIIKSYYLYLYDKSDNNVSRKI